jgi:DNA end-binding protein Ku
MAQAIWSGSISFGLIGIPVKLYPATKRNDVRFHEVERATGRRVRHRRVVEGADEPALDEPTDDDARPADDDARPADDDACARTIPEEPREATPERASPEEAQPVGRGNAPDGRAEREISGDDLVKGYDLGDDRLVTVTYEELQALRPESTHTIELEEFVALRDIDPVFFDRTYLVAAQPNAGAEKPYALLLHAMEEAERIGIGRFVMRTKEHLVALRPAEGALALATLFYQDEVRPLSDNPNLPVSASTTEREEKLALQLVETLTGEWSPEVYRDPFRERVLDLIESKAGSARTAPREPAETATSRVSDLMEALKQSVEAAKEVRSDREASAS